MDTVGKPLLKSANKFNVKVVGLPEVNLGVSSQQTFASSLCFSLFRASGADVPIRDIDTAHRVPKRQASGGLRPVICKFVRRLT